MAKLAGVVRSDEKISGFAPSQAQTVCSKTSMVATGRPWVLVNRDTASVHKTDNVHSSGQTFSPGQQQAGF